MSDNSEDVDEILSKEFGNQKISSSLQSHGKPLPIPPASELESTIQRDQNNEYLAHNFAKSKSSNFKSRSASSQRTIEPVPYDSSRLRHTEITNNNVQISQSNYQQPPQSSSFSQHLNQPNQYRSNFRPIYKDPSALNSPYSLDTPSHMKIYETPQIESAQSAQSARSNVSSRAAYRNMPNSANSDSASQPAPYPSSYSVSISPENNDQYTVGNEHSLNRPGPISFVPHQYLSQQSQLHYHPSHQASSFSSHPHHIYQATPQLLYQERSPGHITTLQQPDISDAVSVRSGATSTTTPIIPHENLEAYRSEIKKSKDPVKQFEFAKQLVLVAEEMRKNPQGLDPQKIKKNRDILHHEALKWIKKASSGVYNGKTGYPEALFYLADCYGNGNLGLIIDHERAFGYYTQGAKQDHPASIYRTGVCYEVGAGPKRDHQRAVQYYRKAAAMGDPAAMFKVGMILLEGSLGQARNPREGVNLLKRAATQADETTPYALHELAILYEGVNLDAATGIVPDPAYAFELYLRAAKLGYAPSQYKLGLAHEYGHLGLAIDAKRSIAWYTKAAQQGEAEAELALSGWYLTGYEHILQQSDKEAYLWARKAANKGLAKAEYAVAYFLEHGVGIEQNLEEARKWYIRSAGQGNSRAIARLNDKGHVKREAQQMKPSDWKRSKDAQNGNCVVM